MLTSKTRLPVPREGQLVRARLLDTVSAGGAPLVLVVGPAGSGKTVLVLQWVQRAAAEGARIAWLTLDPRDNDPARLRAYVRQALAEAGGAGPRVLVVDDLQFLVEPAALDQLAELVEAMPDDLRLVLLSRTRLPDQLLRHGAFGRLVEVGGRDLLFTTEETGRFLGAARDAAEVQESTGGWPFAVGLTAGLDARGARDTPAGGGPTPHRTRRQVADYLTEEVLVAQPEAVQGFLLDTCVLDEITAATADAVRESADAATHLLHLASHDVFLTPVDTGGEPAWRHHSLVRDHLRRQLESRDPLRWTLLHHRAARHFRAAGDLDRAMDHSFAAPDYDLAGELLDDALRDAVAPEAAAAWQQLRWLDALPDSIMGERAALRALGLGLAATLARYDLVTRWLAVVPTGQRPPIEELFAESWRADEVGDPEAARAACLRALEGCDPSSPWWRALHASLAAAEQALGHWEEAADSFRLLLYPVDAATSAPGQAVAQESARAAIAVMHAYAGRTEAAAEALAELHTWLAEAEPLGFRTRGVAAWADAVVAYHRGDLARALRWDDRPNDSFWHGDDCPVAMVLLDLARVRRARGDVAGAVGLVAEVRTTLPTYADPGVLRDMVATEEAALGLTPADAPPPVATAVEADPAGPEALSRRETDVLRMLRSEYSLPEIAGHLFLSYNTVKTHTRTIYRKLGATTRSQAVARARALGYL